MDYPESKRKVYVVEHLDPELGPWSALEYAAIAKETTDSGATFFLSSVPKDLVLPHELRHVSSHLIEHRNVEEVFWQRRERICLLDPKAQNELTPADATKFDVFVFGGILDRTSELRNKGFIGRRLGAMQMTTDTAVRVTRMVVQDQTHLSDLDFIDYPEIKIDKHETTEMPFRYVKNANGKPIMPEGMIELIKKDPEKNFDGLL